MLSYADDPVAALCYGKIEAQSRIATGERGVILSVEVIDAQENIVLGEEGLALVSEFPPTTLKLISSI